MFIQQKPNFEPLQKSRTSIQFGQKKNKTHFQNMEQSNFKLLQTQDSKSTKTKLQSKSSIQTPRTGFELSLFYNIFLYLMMMQSYFQAAKWSKQCRKTRISISLSSLRFATPNFGQLPLIESIHGIIQITHLQDFFLIIKYIFLETSTFDLLILFLHQLLFFFSR